MGARFGHIMLRHLIPNFVSAVMFVIISGISTSMTTESTLSFLGLGLPVEVVSWGQHALFGKSCIIAEYLVGDYDSGAISGYYFALYYEYWSLLP